jgi:metal-responsive CopG/Arc/MetJ family transcriptional regulator
MKTAVSLPDNLFRVAEAEAKKLKVSRSRLYAIALAEFIERRRAGSVTARLNKVYEGQRARVDPAFHRAQLKSLPEDSW